MEYNGLFMIIAATACFSQFFLWSKQKLKQLCKENILVLKSLLENKNSCVEKPLDVFSEAEIILLDKINNASSLIYRIDTCLEYEKTLKTERIFRNIFFYDKIQWWLDTIQPLFFTAFNIAATSYVI